MNSRLRFLLLAGLVVALCVPATGIALEKTVARATDVERDGSWRGSSTCSVSYFNTCTGWLWIWNGWSPNDKIGVAFDTCCPEGTSVTGAQIYVWTGSPSGYGFTGSIDLHNADANLCPTGAALASEPNLPVSGWNTVAFGGAGGVEVTSSFAVVMSVGSGAANPLGLPSDHPAAGSTGPAACGTCFPVSREARSFYWGTATTPVCPGSSLDDGVCTAEFFAYADMTCTTAVSPTSWSQVKNLYR